MRVENKKSTRTTIAQLVDADNSLESKRKDTTTMDVTGGHVSNVPNEVSMTGSKEKVRLLTRLREKNMLVQGSNLSRDIEDDYRRIKRPLVANACGKNKAMVERGNIILVTSSIPGEGKTYTSVNLALSMSREKDTTVLLVDCDVAKQGVSRMLGLENESGLVDVLENDDMSIADVLLQTDIPNLRVVSAGLENEYVTELLSSQRMVNLVEELANRYSDRIIIFDGPPLLPTPQTQILAGLVGQVVFVVEAGKTSQTLVDEALDMIPEEQATGLVLNKNQGLSGRGGTYYGYYGPADV